MLHPALHFLFNFLFNFLFKFACFAGSALVRGQVVGIVVVGMFAKAQQAAAKDDQQHRHHNGRDCVVVFVFAGFLYIQFSSISFFNWQNIS